jgi:hypothetical protein
VDNTVLVCCGYFFSIEHDKGVDTLCKNKFLTSGGYEFRIGEAQEL